MRSTNPSATPPEVVSNGTGQQNFASQFPQMPTNIQAGYSQGLNEMTSSIATENPSVSAPQSNLAIASFGPPKTMSLPKMTTKNVNGWVMPEYSPMDVSALVPHSGPSQFPAQASPIAPSSPYPIR